MHVMRYADDTWEIGYWDPHNDWHRIYNTNDFEQAMSYCSYLNGGFPPAGYNLDVTNHY